MSCLMTMGCVEMIVKSIVTVVMSSKSISNTKYAGKKFFNMTRTHPNKNIAERRYHFRRPKASINTSSS